MRMQAVLREAVLMVKDGCTYQQAADAHGLTRNQVAGACDRAGVKVGPRPKTEDGLRRIGDATRKAMKERWAKKSAAERTEFAMSVLVPGRRRWLGLKAFNTRTQEA